ncbi:MFS general substrate transporter [Tothia fuscella]|uniref:MFS general substrate transporter n=1 Tax=Tothia fuscella TaxID=1048955 RepID=A0A9P4NKL6_9PEZI|nr:MFS general substrate transporter [Tothia fuscella]
MKRSLKPPMVPRRQSSTPHYQTFPTNPPTSRGRPPSSSPTPFPGEASDDGEEHHGHHHETPLPKKQLAILAVIALAEQTALNSISPYLPEMAGTFPEVQPGQEGLYVGLIASSFALAQFATNFGWGWLSDRIGRKPVVLTGTLLTAACFVAFGFCKTLWQAILVQVLMGCVNGNQAVIATCLGEITDRSNQSRAFTYLPVIYGIGGITGPALGGLLVFYKNPFDTSREMRHPYLFPNLFSAAILLVDLVLTMFFLEESLEEAKDLPPLGERVENLFSWIWQFSGSSHRPTYLRKFMGRKSKNGGGGGGGGGDNHSETGSQDETSPTFLPHVNGDGLSAKAVLNRDTILLLGTFLIFQLSNVAYNSLYPVFAEARPPTGRGLSTEEVGLSLAFAGAVTILFQVGIFGAVRDRMGNKATYRASLAGFALAFFLMPFVGYKDGEGLGQGKTWLWFELGVVLVVKTVAAVGGLASALLLITNSAPNHSSLGKINGLAQTLSAAGRAVGPFVSGGIFSAATKLKGSHSELLAFGLFGGIAVLGCGLSFGIRSQTLEAEGEEEGDGDEEEGDGEGGYGGYGVDGRLSEEDEEEEEERDGDGEDSHTPLLSRR